MHTSEVPYISVFKHLLSYVIEYNNPVAFTDNASDALEKCNRNSDRDIWWLQGRTSITSRNTIYFKNTIFTKSKI